jgi:hypothetical protein
MRNSGGKNVSLDTVIKAPAFRQGVRHYRTGVEPIFDKPYEVEGRGRQNTMWSYERGRLFAAFARGAGTQIDERSFFQDRRLRWEIRDLAREAYWAGVFN